jgi:spermidine synthase
LLKKIYEITSPLSGKIEIWQEGVERKLVIDGATQSIYRLDGSIRGYWPGLVPQEPIDSALLMGLGGGTIAAILRTRNPMVKISAYEIDPEVVRVAREFFNLDPAVRVKVASAEVALAGQERFDLVVVDLYQGSKFLDFAKEKDFMRGVVSIINPGGRAAFNRVPTISNEEELGVFEERLREVFRDVKVKKEDQNLVYWGQV